MKCRSKSKNRSVTTNTTVKKGKGTGAARRIWLRRLFTGCLVLGWMFLIGSFSAQTGTESGGQSRSVAKQVVAMEEKLSGRSYTQKEKDARIEELQFPIRKLAHMAEYAILAVLVALHLGCYAFICRRFLLRMLLTFGLSVAYAAVDELHQLFVAGRSGRFLDVCIDGIGAFVGILCVLVCDKALVQLGVFPKKNKKHQ